MGKNGVSLIISVYKRLDFLQLIFESLKVQSDQRFEVIIAEDAEDLETKNFITEIKPTLKFNVIHLSQADNGFRKNKILNKAIVVANFENIVFIDGDCTLHRHFIKMYNKYIKNNIVLCGRRVKLSESITKTLIAEKSIKKINLFNLFKSKSTYIEEAIYYPINCGFFKKSRGLMGCNWGIKKAHLLTVNGFDETYTTPCVGEDVDIEWRLKQIDVKFLSFKHKAIQYHLNHKENYNDDAYKENIKILHKSQKTNQIFALNGIVKK